MKRNLVLGVDRAENLGFSAEFLRKRVSTWTAATNFPAKPPTSPSSLNAMSRPSSLAYSPRFAEAVEFCPRPAAGD